MELRNKGRFKLLFSLLFLDITPSNISNLHLPFLISQNACFFAHLLEKALDLLFKTNITKKCKTRAIERPSNDLEKVLAICITDQCVARLHQSFSLFPPRKLLVWAVNSSIAQSHYYNSNDVKAKCRSLSRKFHGEMTLFASAFAKPMKISACFFLVR